MKGRRDGRTLLNHNKSPSLAAERTIWGNKSKNILKSITRIVIIIENTSQKFNNMLIKS